MVGWESGTASGPEKTSKILFRKKWRKKSMGYWLTQVHLENSH